jgi:glutamate transport system substrate-binding protein
MALPRTPGESGSRQTNRPWLTTTALAVALVILGIAGCQETTGKQPETVQDKLAKTSIAKKKKISIGVYEDTPLMGFRDDHGELSGFDIHLARSIARFLGFEESKISWVSLTTSERDTALQDGSVDLVVASYSITEERMKRVRFAGPYLVTTQAVLIRNELKGQIKEIGDLRAEGQRVCVTGASTTKQQLQDEGVEVETLTKRAECVQGVLSGKYRAMSSDRTILAGFVHQYPRDLTIVSMPFSGNERLGIGIPSHDEHLAELITYYLHRSYQDEQDGKATDWQVAYSENLAPYLGRIKQPRPDGEPPLLVDQDERNPR